MAVPSLRFLAALFALLFSVQLRAAGDAPRLVVLTDIGGDPDDQQSMVRLMTYSCDLEIEGLIASASGTPGELKKEFVQPALIEEIVAAYGKVRDNLLLHRKEYPAAEALRACIKSGNPRRGIASIGEGQDTDGSNWIISVVDKADPRPVNVAIWGGPTELAQALWRVRKDRDAAGLRAFLAKLRVYAVGHQDNSGPWIIEQFPELFYILGKAGEGRDMREAAYRGMYLGGDEALTSREWVETNVRGGHGPLGALYPVKTWTAPNPHATLKEGDTPSWFYFLPCGFNDPSHPEWGSWGGRFQHQGQHAGGGLYRDAKDTVAGVTDSRAAVWRWRPAYQADFQARMDWCVKPFAAANHPPLAVLNGDATRQILQIAAAAGSTVTLSAAGSTDPDGHTLKYSWWIYAEAETYSGSVNIDAAGPQARLEIPADAAGKSVHVILEAADSGAPALCSFRRAVLSISK